MDAAMAATIALKEQTKKRMNFETGYLFCHVETKSFKLWLEALFLISFSITKNLRLCRRE